MSNVMPKKSNPLKLDPLWDLVDASEEEFEISHEFIYDLQAVYDFDGAISGFRGCHLVMVDFTKLPTDLNIALAQLQCLKTGQVLGVCPKKVNIFLVFGGIQQHSNLEVRLSLKHFEPRPKIKNPETNPEDMSLHDYMVMSHGEAYTDPMPLKELLEKCAQPQTLRKPKGDWSRPSEFAFKPVTLDLTTKRNLPSDIVIKPNNNPDAFCSLGELGLGSTTVTKRMPKPTPTPTNGRTLGRRPPK